MRYPWVNVALLILLVLQLITGFYGTIEKAASAPLLLWLHAVGGYTIIVLLLWKGAIIIEAWLKPRRRKVVPRLAFLILTILALAILFTGVYWTFAGPKYWLGFSLITLHALLSLGLSALLVWHSVYMRFIFRVPKARDRRSFLRLLSVSVAGLAVWWSSGVARAALGLSGARRRYTGSYEYGSLTGLFPPTSWLFDNPPPIDTHYWQLTIDGAVARPLTLTYADIMALADTELTALLDCTGGWYTTQLWQGVPLARVLDLAGVQPAAQSITLTAVSGYQRRFRLAEARTYLLATGVAGTPLSHGHGFPLRLVAPNRRGFEWVKWVVHIQINTSNQLWQLPVPLK